MVIFLFLLIISIAHSVHASLYHTAFTNNPTDSNGLSGAMPTEICALVDGGLYVLYDTAEVTPGCN